jgi:hypothetical protein
MAVRCAEIRSASVLARTGISAVLIRERIVLVTNNSSYCFGTTENFPIVTCTVEMIASQDRLFARTEEMIAKITGQPIQGKITEIGSVLQLQFCV